MGSELPAGHEPRIVGVLAPTGLGLALGIWLAFKRRWGACLASVVGGLTLAALAWWFMPTIEGLSLWEANQQAGRLAAELDQTPAGDLPGYTSAEPDRERLARLFPAYEQVIHGAEARWGQRTAAALREDLEKLPPGDVAGYQKGTEARAELGRMFKDLKPQLEAAELAWGERTATAAVSRAEPLFQTDPTRAVAQLRQAARDLAAARPNPWAEERLLAARKRAVLACLEDARRRSRELIKADRFQAAAEVAKRLTDTVGVEADTVGVSSELVRFQESQQFLAELARSAGKADPK
jgi:hypothetical protein